MFSARMWITIRRGVSALHSFMPCRASGTAVNTAQHAPFDDYKDFLPGRIHRSGDHSDVPIIHRDVPAVYTGLVIIVMFQSYIVMCRPYTPGSANNSDVPIIHRDVPAVYTGICE